MPRVIPRVPSDPTTDLMTVPVPSVSDDVPTDESATPAAPAYVVPDRADAPVSEVTERFLRAIIAQVPVERIEELHLFSPLRQGTVETGIAVLATRVEIPVAVVEAMGDEAPELLFDEEPLEASEIDDATIDGDGTDDEIVDVEAEIDVTVDA